MCLIQTPYQQAMQVGLIQEERNMFHCGFKPGQNTRYPLPVPELPEPEVPDPKFG